MTKTNNSRKSKRIARRRLLVAGCLFLCPTVFFITQGNIPPSPNEMWPGFRQGLSLMLGIPCAVLAFTFFISAYLALSSNKIGITLAILLMLAVAIFSLPEGDVLVGLEMLGIFVVPLFGVLVAWFIVMVILEQLFPIGDSLFRERSNTIGKK